MSILAWHSARKVQPPSQMKHLFLLPFVGMLVLGHWIHKTFEQKDFNSGLSILCVAVAAVAFFLWVAALMAEPIKAESIKTKS